MFKYVNIRLIVVYRIKYLKFGVFCPSVTYRFVQKTNPLQWPKNTFSERLDFYSTPPIFSVSSYLPKTFFPDLITPY